ncbi:hypothetical protein DFH09DRAFT_1087264 [Mycena vulgaris]|nr:hypothetical protein DFH09DRAFT_1087264 [Mycena vulgaris]
MDRVSLGKNNCTQIGSASIREVEGWIDLEDVQRAVKRREEEGGTADTEGGDREVQMAVLKFTTLPEKTPRFVMTDRSSFDWNIELAYKAISRWPPNEIITEIILAALQADQASLCRVSKLFHALCRPLLYRVVHPNTYDSLMAFSSTIILDPALADLVRSVKVVGTRTRRLLGPDTSRLLVNSLKALPRLEHLSIHNGLLQREHIPELLAWTFPHLLQCSLGILATKSLSSLDHEDTLGAFLIRHPALTYLHIEDASSSAIDIWPTGAARIPLLHLLHLGCPYNLVPAISARGLHEARISWSHFHDVPNVEVETVVVALAAMTCTDVPFACCNSACDRHNTRPRVAPIRLQETISTQQLLACLPRFTGLIFLSIESLFSRRRVLPEDNSEARDQITVHGFADACSTLEACRFYHAWRKAGATWEVFSVEEFTALSGLSFL